MGRALHAPLSLPSLISLPLVVVLKIQALDFPFGVDIEGDPPIASVAYKAKLYENLR
jgi:hypothetical protein